MGTKAEKLLAKGQGLERKGKLDRALELYRDGCRLAPYDPDVWTARADAARTLGLIGEAAEALFHVSDLFARSGMPAEALKLARRVLELDRAHGGARRFVRLLESRMEDDQLAQGVPAAASLHAAAAATLPVAAAGTPLPVGAGVTPPPIGDSDGVPADISSRPTALHDLPAQDIAARPTALHDIASRETAILAAIRGPAAPAAPEPEAEEPPATPGRVGRNTVIATVPPIPGAPENGAGATPRVAARPPSDPDAPLIDVARAAPSTSTSPVHEFVMGTVTIDTALDALTLGERLAAAPAPAGAAGRSSEIPLDDGNAVDVIQAIASTITTSPLLSELDSDLVKLLVDCGALMHRAAGEAVFRQGEIGTSLYLILAGEVAVERESAEAGERPKELARLRPGAFFGEMALLTNMPRSATVRAVKNVDLLEISRRDVRDMIDRDARVLRLLMRFFRARLVGTLLQTSPLFRPFSRDERRALIARFRLRELSTDFVAIREGSQVEGLFVVLVGRLLVTRAADGAVLGQLGPGDVFGEMSLLDDSVATATVRSQLRSWVLLLGRDDFAVLVERHPEIREHLQGLATERRERNRTRRSSERPVERLEPV